jgi:hypothetical protein
MVEKGSVWSSRSSALPNPDSLGFDVEFMWNMSKPSQSTSSVLLRVMGSLRTADLETKLGLLMTVIGGCGADGSYAWW